MNTIKTTFAALILALGVSATAYAGDIVSTVQEGCKAEIENYCSQVTMGEGRLLACFYAHEDKISGQCQYALYNASAELERAVSSLNYVASQCEDDIMKLCTDVQEIGNGQLLACLEENKESVSAPCTQAISDVFE